jgi:ATP-binding cassette subfamily B protein
MTTDSFRRRAVALNDIGALIWRGSRGHVTALLCVQALQSVLPLATAWTTKLVLDGIAGRLRGDRHANLWPLLIAQLGLAVLSQLLSLASTYLSAESTRELSLDVRVSLFRKVNGIQGVAPFEDPRFHDSLQLAAHGAQYGPSQMLSSVTSLVVGLGTLLSFGGALLTLSPLLGVIVSVGAGAQFWVQLKLAHQHLNLHGENSPRERLASYYSQVLSMPMFAKELRAYNLGRYFLDRFERIGLGVAAAQRTQQQRELRWQLALALCSSLLSGGALAVVIQQAATGRLTIGDIAFYIAAVGSVQGGLHAVVGAMSALNESALFFGHYSRLLALSEPLTRLIPACAMRPLRRGIELRGVSFRYTDAHPWILRGVDLVIPAGERVALVGRNGAGKTTVVKLICRLYEPSEGEILWDGIDIRRFDPEEYRARLGVLFQDFIRYELRAFENIAVGNPALADRADALEGAARRAGIHEALQGLPRGYDTMLSRWLADDDGPGVELSGGQWQKLALARLHLRSADVVLLDEPTAALDAEAEAAVYDGMEAMMRGRTGILVSHRFSTVSVASLIAVLEGGRISDYGTHEELLGRSETYTELYNLQAQHYRLEATMPAGGRGGTAARFRRS